MIEVLKQALEALEKHYPYEDESGIIKLSLGRYMNGLQYLRQAIAELESQDKGYCQACDGALCTAKKGCVALSNPPQRKPLEVDKDGWFWLSKNECIHVDLIRKIETAHGIKE